MDPNYRFPGMPDFLKAAGLSDDAAGQAGKVSHVARARDMLSQLCEAPVAHRQDMMDNAIRHRDELALALAGLNDAIEEVQRNCLSSPKPVRTTKAHPE